MLIVRVIMSPLLSLLFVAVTYCSLWLPQIIRSVRRGRSSGLSKEYVLGMTTCRLFSALCKLLPCIYEFSPTFYADFLGCPKNVLDVETRCQL